jgi:hypothetical protein
VRNIIDLLTAVATAIRKCDLVGSGWQWDEHTATALTVIAWASYTICEVLWDLIWFLVLWSHRELLHTQ